MRAGDRALSLGESDLYAPRVMSPARPLPDRLVVDFREATVSAERSGVVETHTLDSPGGFDLVADGWLRAGWDAKYVYGFSWLGRPVIQLPDDLMRLQVAVDEARPDVVLETGVAHGGSLIFHASLLKALGHGRVIGVDIEIRPHNRAALEGHALAPMLSLIEGSSIDPNTVKLVQSLIEPGERVQVILDSAHSRDHVAEELRAYAPLVGPGCYLIALDGIMGLVAGGPRTEDDWTWNNPETAIAEFVAEHEEFELVGPPTPFNEGVGRTLTYGIGGWLRRRE